MMLDGGETENDAGWRGRRRQKMVGLQKCMVNGEDGDRHRRWKGFQSGCWMERTETDIDDGKAFKVDAGWRGRRQT